MLTQTTVPLHEGPLNSQGYPDRSLNVRSYTFYMDVSMLLLQLEIGVIAVTNDMITIF